MMDNLDLVNEVEMCL